MVCRPPAPRLNSNSNLPNVELTPDVFPVSGNHAEADQEAVAVTKLKELNVELKRKIEEKEREVLKLQGELAQAKIQISASESDKAAAVAKCEAHLKSEFHDKLQEAYDVGFKRAMEQLKELKKLMKDA